MDSSKTLNAGWTATVVGGPGERKLELTGSSTLGNTLGWKVVDPSTNVVLGSGRTSQGGNMLLPEKYMIGETTQYDLYVWGQKDGNETDGMTNIATMPGAIQKINGFPKVPPSYGIELTGTTEGMLKAYKIGDYSSWNYVDSSANTLKDVTLSTPSTLQTTLTQAAEAAGGDVGATGNPIAWVASQWLGYPTNPPTADMTSAYSPYAGQLQLFAQELAKDIAGGSSALAADNWSLTGLNAPPGLSQRLQVSDPGLYLIVDDSGTSLPIIVGTKALNEALDNGDGRFVDFADAGVGDKPRLGQAALKSTDSSDVTKRIVNDADMDGFDFGEGVEYEIELRVPDLSDTGYTSVPFASYEFSLKDVADKGLTMPDPGEVKVLMNVDPVTGLAAADTDVTATTGVNVSLDVDGALLVSGLQYLFAQQKGSGVANKTTVPVGSKIRIRYAAKLNKYEDTKFEAPGGEVESNGNTVTLTRTTSSGNEDSSLTATAQAYSFEVKLLKVDKDDMSKALGGAKFEVSRAKRDGTGTEVLTFVDLDAGVYRLATTGDTETTTEVTTSSDGHLVLQGVEARELSFKETVAPDGYFTISDFTVEVNKVWNPFDNTVTSVSYSTDGSDLAYVSQDGSAVVVADPTMSLANLPYTGGVGILLMSIISGLFFMVAVRPYYLSHCAEATANILI
ncbi:isopeptide-forming domain-containing fimbrial protein [Bifidobacterium crudilactis]|uniref:Isopeptide-forming domain-containing fimbrial protein n=1 Tax=Bifidobacterium crudilactis TaxID=327277 RepID=A0A971D0G7_9BIFI|nr:isopeptide-forming domain-containing fimbrial protein [Bifidobacterium crudilactis]NLT80261.1 isopeptide-forming domain-containing fimbrial protein [Bifidobacterium crudilactis]